MMILYGAIMAKKLAAFDVDGTLTFTDSFMLFLRFSTTRFGFLWRMIILLPVFTLYLVRIINRDGAKNHILSMFFKNMRVEKYQNLCNEFGAIYPKILRQDGIEAVKKHLENGDDVALVSASLEGYLIPLGEQLGVKTIIATKMEIIGDKLSGKMLGPNCRAQEKVNRIRKNYGNIEIIAAYGDSRGDKEMLEAATNAYYCHLKQAPLNAKQIKNALYWG
jgi:phosphatidylglycerophosphatase C